MQRVNFLDANLYSHVKLRLDCVKICKMCTKNLQVGHCFFKVVCLIEVSSKFIQEKTTIFKFLLYHVPLVCVN